MGTRLSHARRRPSSPEATAPKGCLIGDDRQTIDEMRHLTFDTPADLVNVTEKPPALAFQLFPTHRVTF